METLKEKAIKLVVEDIKADLTGYYKDCGIENWSDYLEETGCDSSDVKDNVMYVLRNADIYFNDSNELELEDGSLLTYRKLMNAVRKELKKSRFIKIKGRLRNEPSNYK